MLEICFLCTWTSLHQTAEKISFSSSHDQNIDSQHCLKCQIFATDFNLFLSAFPQNHPLSLCNTSEDERQENDFITIVKLEHRVPRCLPLLDKVQSHTHTHMHGRTHTHPHTQIGHASCLFPWLDPVRTSPLRDPLPSQTRHSRQILPSCPPSSTSSAHGFGL